MKGTPRGFSLAIWSRAWLTLTLFVSLAAVSAAQVAPEKRLKLPPPPADLPGRINYLARQLSGVALDDSGPLTSQIEKLVLDHMRSWLSSHPPAFQSEASPASQCCDAGSSLKAQQIPYDVQVRSELERIFGQLHYPLDARCAAFATPFRTGQLIGLGYSLGWTEFNRASVVALFQISGKTAQQVAVTHFVPYVDVQFRLFNPPASAADRIWFLAYGTRLGKSHPRLSAVLYGFDGTSLQNLWEKTDIYDGQISFTGDRVTIGYLNEDEFTQAVAAHTPAVRHTAAYHLGPKGFEVDYER